MDRNKLITKLQNLTKSGRRPRTSPGLVIVRSTSVEGGKELCQLHGKSLSETETIFIRKINNYRFSKKQNLFALKLSIGQIVEKLNRFGR